jgi:hypothetical protein
LNPENSSTRAPTIGLLSNPHSRRNRRALQAVRDIVANHPAIHHRVTDSAAQVPEALQAFAAQGVDTLAINGGDGTIAQVLTELLERRPFAQLPAVILLPGGTTNMNVGDVGLPGKLTAAVTRMVRWASHNTDRVQRVMRPILRVQGATDGNTVCGMFFGVGTIIPGIEYSHQNIASLGAGNEIGPGLALLRTLWGMLRNEPRFAAPISLRIGLDTAQDSPPREVLLLLVSSLERLFLGMHPYWGQEPGPLHCTWIEKPAPRLLRLFPSLLRGKPPAFATPARGYHSHNAGQIRLWMDGTFTLDGEMHQASTASGPLTISSSGELEFIRIF